MRPLVSPDGGAGPGVSGLLDRMRYSAFQGRKLGGGLRGVAADDRRRGPDLPGAGRLAGQRRPGPAGRLARRARLCRPRGLHLGERHRGSPGAARGAASTRWTPSTWTTPSCGGAASTGSTTTSWDRRGLRCRWRTSRADSSSRWPSTGRRRRSPARASCTSSAAGSTRRASAARSAATCSRHRVPLFVPRGARRAAGRGLPRPPAEGRRWWTSSTTTRSRCGIMGRYMPPGPGTSADLPGRRRAEGLPADHRDERQGHPRRQRAEPAPGRDPDHHRQHGLRRARRRLGGQRVHLLGQGGARTASTSCCFADVTIALPLLCQGLLERYGPAHERRARTAIHADLAETDYVGGLEGPPTRARSAPRRSRGAPRASR